MKVITVDRQGRELDLNFGWVTNAVKNGQPVQLSMQDVVFRHKSYDYIDFYSEDGTTVTLNPNAFEFIF